MSWASVCQASDLEEQVPLAVSVGELDLALVKIGQEVFAIKDLCSHQDYTLSDGEVEPFECTLECLAHGAMFDLRTGEALSMPATKPVSVYPCRIDGNDVQVDVDNPKNQEK